MFVFTSHGWLFTFAARGPAFTPLFQFAPAFIMPL